KLVLDDVLGSEEHPPEEVLASLNKTGTPSYDVVWYFDGTEWLFYNPDIPEFLNTLTEFNDTQNKPYWIKMFEQDKLIIPWGD
ncbi:MAG: hypothetical protein DRP13_04640, partial [Candidatus Aenigmatarchaeota archaeon]